jgi:predicted TIM-barrel fold metal-dependent hydrolase
MMAEYSERRAIVVTADAHIGPITTVFREYCAERYRPALEEYLAAQDEEKRRTQEERRAWLGKSAFNGGWNLQTAGHHDGVARRGDMDRDGVAAEVIFHGSTNDESIPFVGMGIVGARRRLTAEEVELDVAGRHMYNAWLADFCAEDPVRHIGLCQISSWDLGSAVREVEWAHDHGLRGVNFPAPSRILPPYEDAVWEPLFAVCAERGMVLNTHNGGAMALEPEYQGPWRQCVRFMEEGFLGRRAIWLLTFTGVFERYPALRLVITELPGIWFRDTVREMDAAYYMEMLTEIRDVLPRPPSEYVKENVSMGASFQSRMEAEMAVMDGFDDRVMWGSDYPHPEGTYRFPEDGETVPVNRLAIANTFHELPEPSIRRMLGANIIDCYGLDAAPLQEVADRIGPSMDEFAAPPDLSLVPAGYVGCAFRTRGAYS